MFRERRLIPSTTEELKQIIASGTSEIGKLHGSVLRTPVYTHTKVPHINYAEYLLVSCLAGAVKVPSNIIETVCPSEKDTEDMRGLREALIAWNELKWRYTRMELSEDMIDRAIDVVAFDGYSYDEGAKERVHELNAALNEYPFVKR